MTTKMWLTTTEWIGLAPCGRKDDFTLPPETLGTERTRAVRGTCASCPVRPECIEAVVAKQSNSVWVAGVWIGDHYSAANRRAAAALRETLRESLPAEREARPPEVL